MLTIDLNICIHKRHKKIIEIRFLFFVDFESFLSHSRNKGDIWSKDDKLITSTLNKNRKVSSKDQQNRTNKDISSCFKDSEESASGKNKESFTSVLNLIAYTGSQ